MKPGPQEARTAISRGIAISIAFCALFPFLPAQSEEGKQRHFLHTIVFESYLTPQPDAEKLFDAVDLPSREFPWKFSNLCAPSSPPQSIRLPMGLVIPKEPMFLDIYTFRITQEEIQEQKRLSRDNLIQDISYSIKFKSWSSDRYQVELEGRYNGFRFSGVIFDVAADRSKIVRIRQSANRTLHIVLTAMELANDFSKDYVPPKPVTRPRPLYPRELSDDYHGETVKIRILVNRDGNFDREDFLLLQCSHYLLAHSSLDAVLNRWIYKPATRKGAPVDSPADIEVGFDVPWSRR
jgi:hypothetical protein